MSRNRDEKRQMAHDLLGPNTCFNCECLEECHKEWMEVSQARMKYQKSGKLMPRKLKKETHKEICEGTLRDLANKS